MKEEEEEEKKIQTLTIMLIFMVYCKSLTFSMLNVNHYIFTLKLIVEQLFARE